MRTRFLLHLVTASLCLVTARNLCAQDPMAKWKPSVSDKFVYFHTWEGGTYWHGAPYSVSSGTDTITMEILSTDSAYSASYQHVVTVLNANSHLKNSYKTLYYYHPGGNIASTHPFAIDVGDSLCTGCTTASYDFSITKDSQVTYQSNPLTVYSFAHDSEINGNQNSSRYTAAQYSPAFKWFYSLSSSDYEPAGPYYYNGSFGSTTLISAITVHSDVEHQPSPGYAPMTIVQSANYLTVILHEAGGRPFAITLLDPIARTIRSWQMPAGAGERRMTLNIADVPSGIYFLKLEGQGMGEVKKLAILR